MTVKGPHGRIRAFFLLVLFLAAFVPRAAYPVSRPLQWYERSFRFVDALIDGRWADTIVSEHPGVTPMWLIGLAQHAYQALRRAGGDADYALPSVNRAFDAEVFVSVLPLALAIALLIVAAWDLLRRLFGEATAWASAGLLALDPFHIAMSKVVHLDALLSLLMLLSALLLLLYLRQDTTTEGVAGLWRRHRLIVASGTMAGLAFLTKSPAYFLVPYLGLCLLVMRGRAHLVRGYAVPVLLWVGAAAVTYVVLWPAMWVNPWQTLATVFGGVLKHASRAHPQPLYYLGQLVTEDPGPAYYVVSLLVKTTAVSLPLFVVGICSPVGTLWRQSRRSLLLVIGYFVFFFVQMSLGAKKAPRYLLPAFPAYSIIAGVGLVTLGRRLGRRRAWLAPRALVPAALAVQALCVLPYHPYYVIHGNLLAGSAQGGQQLLLATPEGEGLDIAAGYLNGLPGASQLRVGVQLPAQESFRQYFVGETLDTRELDLDYLVFAPVYVTRQLAEDQWGDQWEMYRFRVPAFTAFLHGEPYAWAYRVDDGAQPPAVALDVCFGDSIRLLGFTIVRNGQVIDGAEVNPGSELLATLHWQAMGAPEGDYSVFVHLTGPDGALVAQMDHVPLDGNFPTFLWQPGQRVDDSFALTIPQEAAQGPHQIVVGVYDWRTGERLATTKDCSAPALDDHVTLVTILVRPERLPWWQPLVWVTAGVMAVGGIGACVLGRQRHRVKATPQRQDTHAKSGS